MVPPSRLPYFLTSYRTNFHLTHDNAWHTEWTRGQLDSHDSMSMYDMRYIGCPSLVRRANVPQTTFILEAGGAQSFLGELHVTPRPKWCTQTTNMHNTSVYTSHEYMFESNPYFPLLPWCRGADYWSSPSRLHYHA